jgi:hypothetical protein
MGDNSGVEAAELSCVCIGGVTGFGADEIGDEAAESLWTGVVEAVSSNAGNGVGDEAAESIWAVMVEAVSSNVGNGIDDEAAALTWGIVGWNSVGLG